MTKRQEFTYGSDERMCEAVAQRVAGGFQPKIPRDEALQIARIAAWRALKNARGCDVQKFSYLCQCAKTRLIDYLQSERIRTCHMVPPELAEFILEEPDMISGPHAKAIFARLPECYQRVVDAYARLGDHDAAAADLGVTKFSFKTMLYRAQKLAKQMAGGDL